ncbi:MAG: hypothetical protein SGPRY_014256, partial [Prymnesium sp.]
EPCGHATHAAGVSAGAPPADTNAIGPLDLHEEAEEPPPSPAQPKPFFELLPSAFVFEFLE